MFALISEGITAATNAFLGIDLEVARDVVAGDLLIDELKHDIEAEVEVRLVRGEAVSLHDARSMLAVLRIVPELERSGDLVEHIALRTPRRLSAEIPPRCRGIVEEMGRIASGMWRVTADAYADADADAASRLRTEDDTLDELHVLLTSQLAAAPISVATAIEMGLVARFYERLGDHAVNVARRVQDLALSRR